MPRPKLSVVLATHNEQENLDRCLKSVAGLADEIVIVDGQSTDRTAEIATKHGATVISATNQPNFHINKQKAINAATGTWILLLDADEVVTPDLSAEIKEVTNLSDSKIKSRSFDSAKQILFDRHQQLIESRDGRLAGKSPQIVAFFIPRLNLFLGKPLRHGGVYPDGVIRLIKNGQARLPAKDVHEQFQIDGQVAWLEHELLHYDSPTFSRYLDRANRYTSFTASQLKKKQLPINFFNSLKFLILKPKLTFLSLFFRHKGFLDGFPGFVWALFSALHYPIAYIKYWHLAKKS